MSKSSKNLSSGFASSTTRGMGSFEREVETKMKHLDVFTEDFSPPGTAEVVSGQDVSKSVYGYGKPHDDEIPEADKSFTLSQRVEKRLAAAGNARDQEALDRIDRETYDQTNEIKSSRDQFPGAFDSASDNAAFDVHATDPMRLMKEVKKDLGKTAKDEIDKGEIKGWSFIIYKDDQGRICWEVGKDFGRASSLEQARAAVKKTVEKLRKEYGD